MHQKDTNKMVQLNLNKMVFFRKINFEYLKSSQIMIYSPRKFIRKNVCVPESYKNSFQCFKTVMSNLDPFRLAIAHLMVPIINDSENSLNRCPNAFVTRIYDPYFRKDYYQAYSLYDITFRYDVGYEVTEPNYSPKKSSQEGIHFYRTYEEAFEKYKRTLYLDAGFDTNKFKFVNIMIKNKYDEE